jgi:hypothetical protein
LLLAGATGFNRVGRCSEPSGRVFAASDLAVGAASLFSSQETSAHDAIPIQSSGVFITMQFSGKPDGGAEVAPPRADSDFLRLRWRGRWLPIQLVLVSAQLTSPVALVVLCWILNGTGDRLKVAS